MRDDMDLGCSPIDEDCAQVKSDDDYMPQMRKELQRYKEMMEKRFGAIIQDSGVHLRIKSNPHDFGTYLSLDVMFDTTIDCQVHAAYFMEKNLPSTWDDDKVFTKQEFLEDGEGD